MIQQADGISYVSRTWGDFPDNTGDWTVVVAAKYPSLPVGPPNASATLFVLFEGPDDYSTLKYLFVGTSVGPGCDVGFFVDNGTGQVVSAFTAVPVNTVIWLALTYTAATKTLTLYNAVTGAVLGTAVKDLSGVTWSTLNGLGDQTGEGSNSAIAYCRGFPFLLTATQMLAETVSVTAVMAGALWDNPLQTSIDLTSHNNTLNQFSGFNTPTTLTADPLVAVVAGPPTNTSPANATAVTLDSAIFQDTLTTGAATDVWFKATATATEEWCACGFGVLAGPYTPKVQIFDGLANAVAGTPLYLLTQSPTNRPLQVPVTAGHTYYFTAVRPGAVTPATLIFSLVRSLDLPIPASSIAINDDNVGFPIAYLDRSTGYPIKFIQGIPVGEGVDCLPNGVVMLTNDDDTGEDLTILNADQTVRIVVTPSPAGFYTCVSSDQGSTFFAATNHGHVITVSSDGVIGPTSWELTTIALRCIGVNKERTILYYVTTNATGAPIKRWDLVNNVGLSDLVAAPVNYASSKDLYVLSDGSVVALWVKLTATKDLLLKQYAADGSTLQTVSFGANTRTLDNRLARAIEAGHIWVWNRQDDFFDTFKRVRLSDGAVVETVGPVPEYEVGGYSPAATNTPARAGHSESCGFWMTRSTPAPPLPAGCPSGLGLRPVQGLPGCTAEV